MRLLRLLIAMALVSACWPAQASAAVVEAVRISPAIAPSATVRFAPLSPTESLIPLGSAPSFLSPSLTTPSPQETHLPTAVQSAALSFDPSPLAPSAESPQTAPSARERLNSAAEAVEESKISAPTATSEGSAADSERQFKLLLGQQAGRTIAAAYTGPSEPRPSGLTPAPKVPVDQKKSKRVRGMIAGTAAMKMGMETVTVSVPILVLQTMGGATLLAGLVIVYSLAQAAFAGAAGSLLDRFPAQKVLAGAVASQALLVAGIITLGATGILSPLALFPLYTLVGGMVGIAETSRHYIPPLILGQDQEALAHYNARLHIFYETAGVAGALAAGALITLVGPLWSLALQPPAYLLGAWLFWRIKLQKGAPQMQVGLTVPRLSSLKERLTEYLEDVKAGYRLVVHDHRLRWIAAAFVLPQIAHRLLESLLAPLFAKNVLFSPGSAGYMVTASNLGELVGAALLLRFAAKIKAPKWAKWGAAALALSWLMAFTHALPLVLPIIFFMSMTWASSDLSLRSEIQSSLGEKDQPRATSFMYGAFVLGAAASSLGLGALFDLLPVTLALAGVFALFTVLGVVVFYASRRLTAKPQTKVENEAPKWKDARPLDLYSKRAGFDIKNEMSAGGRWIDIGAGQGNAISSLAGMPGVELTAVNAHRSYVVPGIENVYAVVPNDREILARYGGKVRLVTDVWAAASYTDDALQALIYEALLLGPGGKLVIVTSLERFGSPGTRGLIETFFREHLGQQLRFDPLERTPKEIEAHGDVKNVRVVVTGAPASTDLDASVDAAHRAVGTPRKVKPLLVIDNSNATIWALEYDRP